MDERTLRAHFERAARATLPPSTVDVTRARQAGCWRLRIRRAGIPAASSFGVAVVVGALFAACAADRGDQRPGTDQSCPQNSRAEAEACPRADGSGQLRPAGDLCHFRLAAPRLLGGQY